MKNVFNKLVVVGAVVLLIAVVCVSAVQRFGTDPSTGINYGIDKTMISTSKDTKLFAATDAGLQSAIWYLNGTGGNVYIPIGFILMTHPINLYNVTLIGAGNGNYYSSSDKITEICFDTNGDNITIYKGSKLQNLRVSMDGSLNNPVGVTIKGNGQYLGDTDVLNNVYIKRLSNSNGTGLLLQSISGIPDNHISHSSFRNVQIYGFGIGMKLLAKNSATNRGFITGNMFDSFSFLHNGVSLVLDGSDNSGFALPALVEGNTFSNIQFDPTTQSTEGIVLNNFSSFNTFTNIMMWDWYTAMTNPGYCINITSAHATHNTFIGYFYPIDNNTQDYPDPSIFVRNVARDNVFMSDGSLNIPRIVTNMTMIPTTNLTSNGICAGYLWYSSSTHKLYVYEGAGVWKSSTFT